MTERKIKSVKEAIKNFLSRIFAIVLGISISFWFDEWRNDRKDRDMEQKILHNMKENLVQDSFVLEMTGRNLDMIVQGAEKLVQFKQGAEIADSVSYYIDMAASYAAILTNQTIYEEIKQTGNTRLIQNDTLKKAILGHYTGLIPYVKEWCEVDKTYTMNQVIPEMSNYFPVTIDTIGMVPAAQKIKALKTPRLRHLLITNVVYKKEAVKSIKLAANRTKQLIGLIDKELNYTDEYVLLKYFSF